MKTSIKIFLLIISVTLLVTAISLFTSESQTTTASTVGNWYKDPAAIRAFVNSVYGYTLIPTAYHGAGALNYDSATALKVCQLAGFDSVDSYSCTHDPRCGYSSCNDNVLAKWNTNTKKFDIVNACTLGNKWIATLVCKNTAPICTTHFSKKCVGNSIYWFDSCNAQEDVYQTCTANQICQDAKCVDVACSTNSQCGTNGYVGELFCEGNNVYRNYKTYTCNNPGTINSSCSNSTTAKLQQTCTTNQTCSNGACVNLPIVCSTNSQCGTNGYVGGPYCIGNSVYKNYKEYICLKPGTINSSCTDSVSIKLFNNCSINQTCNLGICVDQPITCSTNSQCGTNGYVGDAFCSGGDVYKSYRTYTCNNPGTVNSTCSSATTDKLVTNCSANQTCSNGACVNLPIVCSTNSQCGTNGYVGDAFCSGGDVYKAYRTYVCNNPGTTSSSCLSTITDKLVTNCGSNQTCSNGACVDQEIACSTNSQCGTNGYVGDAFCSGGDVYKAYRTYVCNNPGTTSSSCLSTITDKLVTNCGSNQTCSNGACVDQEIACSTNSQCGTNGYVGDAFCSGGDVYKSYRTYTCNNPGTVNSTCSSATTDKLVTNCSANQTCSNGACVNLPIVCSTNSQCGTNGYVGDAFCSGGDVYKAYRTYVCNNPGTTSSSCLSTITDKLVTNCGSNQTCSNGACVDQEIACSTNSQCGTNGYVGDAFCSGGDVYKSYRTYTCNNPGTVNSTCSSATTDKLVTNCSANQTCSNGACVSNCIIHSYKQCFGNYLYWYDSCGTREDIAEYCSNGCSGNACISSYNINVQTNSPTNITNNQATLNGNVYGSNSFSGNVWFQWGTSTSYGNETSHQSFYNLGNFNQIINLNYGSNTTYHYRAVAQAFNGNIVYGQNMTFTTGSTTGSLNISKTARNLSSGSSGFSTTVYANPSDVIMFMITIQPNSNQEISNIYVRDTLPANLIYKGNLVVSGSNNYSGDINYGMNFGTITGNQIITITYQTQVAGAANFAYGTTTLNNSVSVTGSNLINNPTSNASVVVSRTAIQGISTISTGLTNNFWTDSFLLPLLIALVGMWMLKTGMFGGIEKWIDAFKQKGKNYKAEKELNSKISQIRELEKLKN